MKMVPNKKIYFILVFSTIFLPHSVFASTAYIDTNHSDFFVGDTILFRVHIDSEGKNINATEGEVLLDSVGDTVSLTDINTSGSKFSVWPGKPLPSENNTSISFAGGSPGGLNSKDAIVFNIVLTLKKAGQIMLIPKDISVYLNDGKGTKDEVHLKGLVVDISPQKPGSLPVDDWSNLILNDKTPPEPFEIYAGQEGTVFDGKKFLSFGTTDTQSGIIYYEVLENNLPPVRSSGTYILQEQHKPVKVTVVAYDSAGNTRDSVYSSESHTISYLVGIIGFIILLGVVFRKMRKTKK